MFWGSVLGLLLMIGNSSLVLCHVSISVMSSVRKLQGDRESVLFVLEFCFCGIACWSADDSHRTLMQVIYPAHVIAAAAFYFARKFTHTQIPKNLDGKEWWEQYGVRIEDLRGTPT